LMRDMRSLLGFRHVRLPLLVHGSVVAAYIHVHIIQQACMPYGTEYIFM
jgi:hypothetical protein